MKRAFLLVLLTAAPALAGGWPWRRCETSKFQSEYSGFVDHWAPVVESVNAAKLCEPEHSPLILQQQLALTFASPTVVGPQIPPALPTPRPAATTPPSPPATAPPAGPPASTRPR